MTLTDQEALALTIWGEARGEPIEAKLGVAAVIRNRVLAHYFGAETYVDVCTTHAQFSAWRDEAAQMNAEEAAYEHHPDPALILCDEIAKATIAGLLPDPTHGANHYYAETITQPYWAVGVPAIKLGHQFFLIAA